jgi:Lar family restriction alleviation protein
MTARVIKPCPFCGANATGVEYWDDPNCDQWRITCSRCPADMQLPVSAKSSEHEQDKLELIDCWNKRT